MRVIAATAGIALLFASVLAQADDTPELTIQTTFPNDAFSRVSNGQANRVVFTVSPPRTGADSDRILTLESITGAFLNRNKEGKKGFVMRNVSRPTSTVTFSSKQQGVPLIDDHNKVQVFTAQAYRWQAITSSIRLLPRVQAATIRCRISTYCE